AQAAFVFPLAHGATFRVAIPLEPEPETRRPRRIRRRLAEAPAFPSVVPPAEAVAKGWKAQSDRGLRIDLPDERLAEAVAQPALPAAAPRRPRHHARAGHLPPVLVPRRRLHAGRAGPLRVPRGGRAGA